MIIFSVIAYNEKYQKISLHTIETFNKFCKNSKMNIITNDIIFYDQYLNENIMVTKGLECLGMFKANMKYQGIKESLHLAKHDDYIIVMDADCFFDPSFDDEAFNSLNYGLTVQINLKEPVTRQEIQNNVISYKLSVLNPNDNYQYYPFREACLIFKVDEKLENMMVEWQSICNTIDQLNLNHAAETFDIQVAALRQNYKINSLGNSPISNMIKMTDDNGGIGSPL